MNSESEVTFKEKLGARLMNFPMLRQLLFEFWFRVVFILFLLGGSRRAFRGGAAPPPRDRIAVDGLHGIERTSRP